MNITVSSSAIHGTAAPPPSKSAAHRALICAALAGEGSVRGVSDSEDMRATLGAVRAMELDIRRQDDTVTVTGEKHNEQGVPVAVDCLESGSTLRFFIPIFAAKGVRCIFKGQGRLPERPLGVYEHCLPMHGITLKKPADFSLPLEMAGKLQAGFYELPGNISSQFISGLLFALPLCGGNSEIRLTTPLESAAYIEMTADAMSEAGVKFERTADGWRVPGNQRYRPHAYSVESDWSQAAFLFAMGALGGGMTVTGLNLNSRQGDREIVSLLRRFGADITSAEDQIICRQSDLHGITVDASQIPDLVPILAVLGSFAHGTTNIKGAARLRLKESNRLAAMARCLNLAGGKVIETADGLRIEGARRLRGGVTVPGFHDHRIVMSMAVAALGCEQPLTIENAESVSKSWPEFFTVFNRCGGEAHGF